MTTGEYSIYPCYKGNSTKLIEEINQVVDSFEQWKLPVVYIRSEITDPVINLVNDAYKPGTPGVKYDRRLRIVNDLEVVKSSKDSFRNTSLDSILITNQVDELVVAGLDAAECVNATIEAASNRHYRVKVIEGTVISRSPALTDSMLSCFKNRQVEVIRIEK